MERTSGDNCRHIDLNKIPYYEDDDEYSVNLDCTNGSDIWKDDHGIGIDVSPAVGIFPSETTDRNNQGEKEEIDRERSDIEKNRPDGEKTVKFSVEESSCRTAHILQGEIKPRIPLKRKLMCNKLNCNDNDINKIDNETKLDRNAVEEMEGEEIEEGEVVDDHEKSEENVMGKRMINTGGVGMILVLDDGSNEGILVANEDHGHDHVGATIILRSADASITMDLSIINLKEKLEIKRGCERRSPSSRREYCGIEEEEELRKVKLKRRPMPSKVKHLETQKNLKEEKKKNKKKESNGGKKRRMYRSIESIYQATDVMVKW